MNEYSHFNLTTLILSDLLNSISN